MTQLMIDCTGAALPNLLDHLRGNYPAVMAGYVTGSAGVDWEAGFWNELSGHAGLFRYDQSPALAMFGSGAADAADCEPGAARLDHAVEIAAERELKHGWWSWLYFSAGQLADARNLVHAAGLKKVRYVVADWNLDQAAAESFLHANGDVNAVQWASPTSNPHTVVPGTSATLQDLNCDLNVIPDGWFSPPRPTVPAKSLSSVSVAFTDGTAERWGAS